MLICQWALSNITNIHKVSHQKQLCKKIERAGLFFTGLTMEAELQKKVQPCRLCNLGLAFGVLHYASLLKESQENDPTLQPGLLAVCSRCLHFYCIYTAELTRTRCPHDPQNLQMLFFNYLKTCFIHLELWIAIFQFFSVIQWKVTWNRNILSLDLNGIFFCIKLNYTQAFISWHIGKRLLIKSLPDESLLNN